MFTGLIQGKGTILRIDRRGVDARVTIQSSFDMGGLILGESIAVDGVCLTVTHFQGSVFTVDVSAETLMCTTLNHRQPGTRVNLERALRMGDRLGGHLVTGHIDGLGVLRERRQEGRSWRLYFTVPEELSRSIIPKGSIAVNGISLTVNGCTPGNFDVNIIPHTLAETTLGELAIGDAVNIETDLIGKYVEKMIQAYAQKLNQSAKEDRLDADFLKKHGFM